MAPQPPLFPPAAFDRGGGGLPSWDPSRTSNPSFDQGFLKAAFDGELHLVKKAARVVGRGAEGSRLAEKMGAVRDGYGMGLLHTAALGGSLPVCRYLVEDIRLDVDDVGPMGETPLTVAIGCQNVDLVRYFLDQGAATMKLNDSGSTPLHLAAAAGSCEIVELLLSSGAYVDALHLGGTALHSAARDGRDDIVKVLLDHHADHKITLGGTGYTALAIATVVHSLKCVKLLLEAGADVDGNCKETPLIIAAISGSTEILKCLVLAGADANVPDSVYFVCILGVSIYPNRIKIHETSKLGRAPIEIAARSGRREDVEILFPVTSRIPNVCDWSVDGIIRHVKSVRPAKKAMLTSAKSKAHEAFKNGNYYLAARIYKEAMALDPGNATLLSNRSLCWLCLGDAKNALNDAQACIMMRPGWPKASYRQGTALMLLKDYEKACGAFLDGLKLEPGNIEMEDGLQYPLCSFWLHWCLVLWNP
ncbi:ankyrin repeat and protein kinase domain-containing protein 1-like isoform X3 [Triticum dicoccoides]|uniref:ankyrin repeat and protein kinase domain-containing protein 1-like isoform X3 n=1 Tax=Triticum dicoccoides TaxID=85692 RepID=UPI00188E2D4C|nr:ankyrin repeat and protein kinase domain-containing protein 1-like isoform X3 [Triticum dicoccoides]